MDREKQIERLELGAEPQTLEELRRFQAQMPPRRDKPRPDRAEGRSRINLPVQIAWKTSDGRQHVATAHAREIASTSVYFEVDADAHLSSPDLLLELEPGQELSLCAVARVARVESRGGKIGIAVVLEDYCFRAMS